jgi:hypothetical protein
MTVWTILVVACLSWPCFLESSRTCSFIKLHSFARLAIVTMAMMMRDVDARSEALNGLVRGSECASLELMYLAGLLLECEQVVDAGLRVALLSPCQLRIASDSIQHTAPCFSASGMAASVSLEKSLSALSTSPLDMVAGL